MNVGNQLFNFCVGVGVGGHDATNFSHILVRRKLGMVIAEKTLRIWLPPTQIQVRAQISNSDSQEIESKVWYP